MEENNNIQNNEKEYVDISNFSNTQSVNINRNFERFDTSSESPLSKTGSFGDFSEMASFSEEAQQTTGGIPSVHRQVKKSTEREKKEAKRRNIRKRRKNRIIFNPLALFFTIFIGIFMRIL